MKDKAYFTVDNSCYTQNGVPAKELALQNTELPGQDSATKEAPTAPLFGSCRLLLSVISSLGFMNLFAQRVNLSVAMVCMVNHTALVELKTMVLNGSQPGEQLLRPDTCIGRGDNITTMSLENDTPQDGDFAWPKEIQGLLLSSFFWGYVTTQIAGGWLAERFGGKRVFAWSMFSSSVLTMFMPLAARGHYGALFALRIIAGACQGVVWPSMNVMWSRWAPPSERQKLMASSFAGSQIGTCITYLIAAALCTNGFDGGWPSLFYIIGMLGIVWCLAWSFLVYDSPEEHPRISKAEKEYICFSLRGNVSMSLEKRRSTPWKSLLTSTKVWALCVSYFCANWGNYTLLTNIPTYMLDVLYFDIQKNGLTSALPYVGFFIVANISGALYDVVIARKLCSRTVARKIGNTIGLLVPGLFIVGLGFMDCTNPIGAVALLTTSLSMAGFQYGAGFLTYAADIAPQYTGVIFGLANTLATVPGIIAPTVTGYLTTDQLQSQWQLVFFISAGFSALGAAIFIIFGSSEIQEWAVKPYEHIHLMKHSSSSQQANITATCVDRRKDKPESR